LLFEDGRIAMNFRLLEPYRPQLLAALRIVVGLLFLEHATQKFFAFPVPFPLPGPLPPLLIAAGVVELVTGILVTLGLFTRLAAFIASGEMAVAYFMQHFPKSVWPAANNGEAAILFCFIFLYLAAAGGGAWSIDGMRAKPVRSPSRAP
jgi:putative oxidoreductase